MKHIGPQKEHSWKLSLASEAHMFYSLLSNCLKSIFKCLKKEFYFPHMYRQSETEIQCVKETLALCIYLHNLECSPLPALTIGPYVLIPTEFEEIYSV